MSRRALSFLPWILVALLAALFAAWLIDQRGENEPARAQVNIAAMLSTQDVAGYQRAIEPRAFDFPADHGPHAGFRTEWWYFTGNLADRAGRRFGYQLTFFRSALSAKPVARESTFAADHAWMAHFTLSDIDGKHFHSFERLAREAAGIAGATEAPPSVWLRDWRLDIDASGAPLALRASEQGVAIDLVLRPSKPAVLQGENGLSRKNADAGNASYYYSLTRLATSGSLAVAGDVFAVEGNSWMDREWMTSALSAEQSGWDWFALTLDDGTELTWYQLRRKDGNLDPFSGGSFVAPDGANTMLRAKDLQLTHDRSWTSPRSKAVYPARWELHAASLELELQVTPLLADQELDVGFRYWEGAVEVRGTRAGRELAGRGYVELVGYSDQRLGASGRAQR